MIKDFEQRKKLNYNETFVSVIKSMSYKVIFAIAATLNMKIEQMNVKIIFLYDDVKEEIYVKQSSSHNNDINHVCKLNEVFYDLKQNSRIWYNTLFNFLVNMRFKSLNVDLSVFIKDQIIISIYVNDLLIVDLNTQIIVEIKNQLNSRFQMINLDSCSFYLKIKITCDRQNRVIRLKQVVYVKKILQDLNIWNAKSQVIFMNFMIRLKQIDDDYKSNFELRKLYQFVVNFLMYVMLSIRLNIAFVVFVISCYKSNFTNAHL